MKTRCIIVDDEPLAISALSSLLNRFDDIEVIATCGDTFEAFDLIQKEKVDLMFLDVQMPEVSGISFLRTLRNPPAVILTTAYKQYALEAFELDVVDYLLKPVSFERLMKAINKYYQSRQSPAMGGQLTGDTSSDFIMVRAERKNMKVKLDDVLWVMSVKDYVQIVTRDKKILTQVSIGEMENSLPSDRFLRTHRSYLVNISKVTAYTNLDVEIGDMEIPIGRSYKNLVSSRLGQVLGPGH